ncbi:MAG: hypothetical protein Q9159_000079 [Coniocarpon cinnabarinum]
MSSSQPPSSTSEGGDHLITSDDPHHPANHIPSLCAHFYTLGWVTGTGGGTSIRRDDKVYLAPTGVQKELIKPQDIFVLPADCIKYNLAKKDRISHHDMPYLRQPKALRASACTPLFLTSFRLRDAMCCIHTHSQWAVLATLVVDRDTPGKGFFEIERLEQIKGIPKGPKKPGNLGYLDRLKVPIIPNTPKEEDLTESLERAILEWPDTYAVLVERHGIYVWGDTVAQAKTICESLDYIFQLAVNMSTHRIPWTLQSTNSG